MPGILNKSYYIFLLILFVTQNIFGQQTQPVGVDSIIIRFNQAPTPSNLSVNKAALKYNKDFALSLQIDDGNMTAITHGYPVFEGGEIYGTVYPGLKYSDGCGNTHNFKMSSSIYSFNGNGLNGPDVHVDNLYGKLSWQELDSLYQNNWGIYNHGINGNADTDSAFIHYSIVRNQSYIRRKLFGSTPGGVITKIFVNPNGVGEFTQPSFDLGNISALNQRLPSPLGVSGGDVNDPSVDWTQPQNLYRLNADVTNVINFVQGLVSSSSNGANYWGAIFTHSLLTDYQFNTFRSDFNSIANTYGINGLDNILMASDEEIQDYLIIRDAIDVDYDIIEQGTAIRINFTGNVPVDLLYYSSSLIINSDTDINEIVIYGTNDYSHNGTGQNSALININWEGHVIPDAEDLADSYTAIAINSESQYDCYIAMDYVITLESGQHKDSLRQLLCAIPNATYDDGFCLCNIDIQPVDTLILSGSCIELTGATGDYSYQWLANNTHIDTTKNIITCPVTTTIYNHIATNSFGCPAEDSIIVNVFSLDFDLGSDTTICQGNCVDLSGPYGMDSYEWIVSDTVYATRNAITVCPPDTNRYILNITKSGLQNSDTIFVNVNPAPLIVLGNDTTILRGNSIILHGPDPGPGDSYTYLWSTAENTKNITLWPTDSTHYYLDVTNTYACSDSDSVWVYPYSIPIITESQAFFLTENSLNGEIAGTVIAIDADENTILQDWEIVSGNTSGTFVIIDSTGIITVADSTLLDYENQKSFSLGITVSDGLHISDTVVVTIDIGNLNDMYISNIMMENGYCADDTTYSISYDINEYIAPLSFLWTTGDTVQNLENIVAGNQTVIITDSTGFSITEYFVLEPKPVYDEAKICYVSSDTIENWHNKIYINKGEHINVDKFIIYRLMSNDSYAIIGEIPHEKNFFTDSLTDNRTTKFRYKAGVLDSCGIYSSLSDYHETLHLTGNQFIKNIINLSWNNYTGVNYNTIKLYRSINNEDFEIIASLPANNNSYIDNGIDLSNNLYKYFVSIVFTDSCDISPGGAGTAELRSNLLVLGNYYTGNTLVLNEGWNIISLNHTPDNLNMLNILDPLIQSENLIKCLNETGDNIQYFSGIGWVNNIGEFSNSEGYYIKVNQNTSLLTRGKPIDSPYTTELSAGWNIMSYPLTASQAAIDVLQTLINDNELVKVMNESGELIQNISGTGWINTIIDFEPGEGYYINVTNNTSIIFTENRPWPFTGNSSNYRKSNITHLIQNPFKPMNILFNTNELVGFTPQIGDMFQAFDGELCVGIAEVINSDTIINLAATASDGESQGFIPGNTIRLQYLSSIDTVLYNLYPEEIYLGEMKFKELGSLYARYNKFSLSAHEMDINMILHIYPNPVSQELSIVLSPTLIPANKPIHIIITNLLGKQFIKKTLPAGQTTDAISVNNLPAGIYQLIISTGKNTYSRKFVKL